MGEKFQNKLSDQQMMHRRTSRDDDKFGVRGVYSRDLTAIIHSRAFQRLKHKTQLFFHPQNDHLCTRMEHSLYVASIANTICENLGLNGTLAQAMALGHDLGHAPFGHVGEDTICSIFKDLGVFRHAEQSLRIVDVIELYGKSLNLTFAVRNGIIAHSGESNQRIFKIPEEITCLFEKETISNKTLSWEACVVKICDRIAYIGRDLEDAITAGILQEDEIPKEFVNSLGHKNGEIIDILVQDVIAASEKEGHICYSEEKHDFVNRLYNFEIKYIYKAPINNHWNEYVESVLTILYNYYNELIIKFGSEIERYERNESEVVRAFGRYIDNHKSIYLTDGPDKELNSPKTIVRDYITGMTDRFALDTLDRILHMGTSGFGKSGFIMHK